MFSLIAYPEFSMRYMSYLHSIITLSHYLTSLSPALLALIYGYHIFILEFRLATSFTKKPSLSQMSRVGVPIIAALKGHVITGGFELALACDILVGDTTTTFRDTHVKFGLPSALLGIVTEINKKNWTWTGEDCILYCRTY